MLFNHVFNFNSRAQPAHPFVVDFSATLKGPDGKSFTIPGFFGGDGTWQIRVSPTDPNRMNLALWRHYDRVIETLHQRGIQSNILDR